MSQEQRHFSRIPFDAKMTLMNKEGRSWQSNLLDISLKGALVEYPEKWQGEIGEEFHLEIRLSTFDDDTRLNMDTHVAHIGNDKIGFECEQMDLDTATHLHRLVELNLGSEELLERELAELIHIKSA